MTHLDTQSVIAYVRVEMSYDDWATSHGLSGDDALDNANPSGDGVVNLMKYALSLDPNVSVFGVTDGTNPRLPVIIRDAEGIHFVFLRNPDASDITYTVEACSDLQSWNPVTEGMVETVLPNGMIRVEVTMPAGQQVFCRLSVTR